VISKVIQVLKKNIEQLSVDVSDANTSPKKLYTSIVISTVETSSLTTQCGCVYY
jgi:hypothetical protein